MQSIKDIRTSDTECSSFYPELPSSSMWKGNMYSLPFNALTMQYVICFSVFSCTADFLDKNRKGFHLIFFAWHLFFFYWIIFSTNRIGLCIIYNTTIQIQADLISLYNGEYFIAQHIHPILFIIQFYFTDTI